MNLSDLEDVGFDILTHNHAKAVLTTDFSEALSELCETLHEFEISDVELIRGGGGEASLTQRLRRALSDRGWLKRSVIIRKIVDNQRQSSTTHEIDHIRRTDEGTIALEIEWNNKDLFFDRDLENFQRLHGEGAISVGVIVTRGSSLQKDLREIVRRFAQDRQAENLDDLAEFKVRPTERQRTQIENDLRAGRQFIDAWSQRFTSDKFGAATTHWGKLLERLDRGVGGPCPLLLLGIPSRVVRATA